MFKTILYYNNVYGLGHGNHPGGIILDYAPGKTITIMHDTITVTNKPLSIAPTLLNMKGYEYLSLLDLIMRI